MTQHRSANGHKSLLARPAENMSATKERGTEMTRTKFIRLSGWGMVLAAISLLLTFLSDLGTMPFLFAILLMTLGLLGLRARYGEQAGNTAKLALGAGVLGGAAGIVSNLLMTIGYENGRSLMNFSMAVMFAGLFVFGLVALRENPMPRGNGLPALAGFWFPFIVMGANVYHQVTGHWLEVPGWLSFTIFSVMGFFLASLGYVLQSDAPPEQAAA